MRRKLKDMSWFTYAILLMAITLVVAIVAIIAGKRKHWVTQTIAIVLCALAFYCHVQAEMHGEYRKLSEKIAEPLVKDFLQPFALSNLGQKSMNALQIFIQMLEKIIRFIDNNQITLTLVMTAIICLVATGWSKWKK